LFSKKLAIPADALEALFSTPLLSFVGIHFHMTLIITTRTLGTVTHDRMDPLKFGHLECLIAFLRGPIYTERGRELMTGAAIVCFFTGECSEH
jgi:hypothetical protein